MVKLRQYLLSVSLIVLANGVSTQSLSEDEVDSDHSDEDTGRGDSNDEYDDDIKYIYDHYFESELNSNYQYRGCVDHRKNCYSWRHLCPDDDEDDDDDHTRHQATATATAARWMIAHCPRTCHACPTHQVRKNVPYKETIKYEMETKIRLLPNDHNLYSKINPHVAVDTIRDAVTGTAPIDDRPTLKVEEEDRFLIHSRDAIGIQFLMSTTARLHNGVTYEQRNAMMRHVQDTQVYYTSTVAPMERHPVTLQREAESSTFIGKCRNQSPYCTYWAVVFDRCQDPFYHLVMSQHCPVTCRRCHEIFGNHSATGMHESVLLTLSSPPDSMRKDRIDSVNRVDAAVIATAITDDNVPEGDEATIALAATLKMTVLKNSSSHVFDSKNCVYDRTAMPDVWYPNTYSVNQMFERIVATTVQNHDHRSNHHQHSQTEMTILSQPSLDESPENESPPWLIQIDNFLTHVECHHLIELGSSLGFERSTGLGYTPTLPHEGLDDDVDDSTTETNRQLRTVISNERTSSTTWCHHSDCGNDNVVIQSIYHRIQNLTRIPMTHFESLQLLQYQMDQYYNVRGGGNGNANDILIFRFTNGSPKICSFSFSLIMTIYRRNVILTLVQEY